MIVATPQFWYQVWPLMSLVPTLHWGLKECPFPDWCVCTKSVCNDRERLHVVPGFCFSKKKKKRKKIFHLNFKVIIGILGYSVQLSNLHGSLLCLPTWTTIRVNINFLQQQSNLVLLLKCLLFHFPQALCPCQSNYNKPCCMLLGLSLTKQQPWQAPGMARAGRA